MDDADKKQLYTSLLRGIANDCQDRLCAQDIQHNWGPVYRFVVTHDFVPTSPVKYGDDSNETFLISGERICGNCGKTETV